MIYGDQNSINAIPVATTYNATVSSTVNVTLNSATRKIYVTAVTSPILLRWGTSAASTSSFHAVISPNSSLFFNVPFDSTGTLYTAVNFIQTASNAILIVCEY